MTIRVRAVLFGTPWALETTEHSSPAKTQGATVAPHMAHTQPMERLASQKPSHSVPSCPAQTEPAPAGGRVGIPCTTKSTLTWPALYKGRCPCLSCGHRTGRAAQSVACKLSMSMGAALSTAVALTSGRQVRWTAWLWETLLT